MLKQIADDGGNVKKYVDMAKDKTSNFRLMGFGHRVYKNYDPRAKIIKAASDMLLKKLNLSDPLFEVAQELEAVALRDPYFVERKLYPNVDFYSGVIYRAMGIPVQMFTVLFAMEARGREPGMVYSTHPDRVVPVKRVERGRVMGRERAASSPLSNKWARRRRSVEGKEGSRDPMRPRAVRDLEFSRKSAGPRPSPVQARPRWALPGCSRAAGRSRRTRRTCCSRCWTSAKRQHSRLRYACRRCRCRRSWTNY
jgi:hypothetical protein